MSEPIPIDELASAFLTLIKLEETYRPGSDERDNLIDARLLILGEALGHYGVEAWGKAGVRANAKIWPDEVDPMP